jgi:serine/threonine-protein kinase
VRSLTFTKTIGSGAFGTVYKADLTTDQGFRRQVAVKVILADHAEKEMFITRLRDEARLLGLLQGDHILKVIDLLSVNERDAIIMEYVEGIDLSDALKEGQLPPIRAILEIGAIVAGTLDLAHAARHPESGEHLGVVHRDVKPANVMITGSGSLKLLDFGIAQARFEARESQTGQMVLGTLNYMAPDYIITGEVTPAIDVYGLGLTLFELATGEVFGQPTLREDWHNKRLLDRLELVSALHFELSKLLEAMLHWNPESRPKCSECEKALLIIADEMRGPGLRRYAAEVVPSLLAKRKPAPDQEKLLGTTLKLGEAVIPEAPTTALDVLPQVPKPSTASKATVPPQIPPTSNPKTEDAPTHIGPRTAVSKMLEPHTADTAITLPPAPEPDKSPPLPVAEPSPTFQPTGTSLPRAILQGVLIGSTVGALAVGMLAIVLFYLFPPAQIP